MTPTQAISGQEISFLTSFFVAFLASITLPLHEYSTHDFISAGNMIKTCEPHFRLKTIHTAIRKNRVDPWLFVEGMCDLLEIV